MASVFPAPNVSSVMPRADRALASVHLTDSNQRRTDCRHFLAGGSRGHLSSAFCGNLSHSSVKISKSRKLQKGRARTLGPCRAQLVPPPPAPSVTTPSQLEEAQTDPLYDPAYRQRLAEEYGFRHIGEPLPSDVTLKQVINSIPPEAFELNGWKAWSAVVLSIAAFSVGIAAIAVAPWYLLPFAWTWTGTAFTGFFVIGHDCAHKSFSKNKLVEDLVGTLAFMPLIYPYEPWRIKHDKHHAKTNMLVEDTAWHPVVVEKYESMGKGAQVGLQWGMGGPLRCLASIGHWIAYHFDLGLYRESEKPRVRVSLAAVFAFIAIGWPLIIAYTGLAGWFKFWLMPWLGYHFWMSTFTMVHHTAPHIPFKPADEWNAAQAQLAGTVHCDYPKWIEVLCHDINVHIPHHVSQRIPWYNLRLANDALRQRWQKHLSEASWNWRLMKSIFTECHVYNDATQLYLPFDAIDASARPFMNFMRKVMPNTAA